MIDVHKYIYDYIRNHHHKVDSDKLELGYTPELAEYLNSNNIVHEKIREVEIHVNFSELGFDIYSQPENYLIESIVRKDNDILILNYKSEPLSLIEGQHYKSFNEIDHFYFFINAKTYLRFIEFLIDQDGEQEESFHFIDYFNDVTRKIVLTSLSEKSRIILKYQRNVPHFDDTIDYQKNLEQFRACFESVNHDMPKFLKSAIIKHASRYNIENRLEQIFVNLLEIIQDARMTFEIYINNLSIDAIKKDYDDLKAKYFYELSGILSKLTNKIVALPIGISAMLLAIEKIKDDTFFLLFLLVTLIATTAYLSILLRVHFRDLAYIQGVLKLDYKKLIGNNFFANYPSEADIFQSIKERVNKRIHFLSFVTKTYYWLMNLANCILTCYILVELSLDIVGTIFIFLVLMFGIALMHKYIFDTKDLNRELD